MENVIFYMNEVSLGDELHFERNMILDLLEKKYIKKNVIICCFKDRTFFYENIFDNIFCIEDYNINKIEEFVSNKFQKSFYLIKIRDLSVHPTINWEKTNGYLNMLDSEIIVSHNNIFGYLKYNYFNYKKPKESFKELVLNINYLDILPRFNNEKYIVYHNRNQEGCGWVQNDDKLNTILNLKKKYNIVLFNSNNYRNENNQKIDSSNIYSNLNEEKIYTTNNLKEFASFINNNNCIALISVWSGGGQIGGYCNNTKTIMHFDKNQCISVDDNIDKYIDSENAFDFCHFTKSERIFVKEENFYNIEEYL
jgi:hypothetical protein